MVIQKLKNCDYYGPRAIFDPLFIPPKLLYRKKEVRTLSSLLKDSLNDQYSLNVQYQGINGIGKKVIVNKVLQELKQKKIINNEDKNIFLNCNDKTTKEFIFLFLSELNSKLNLNLELKSLLNSNTPSLWNFLKLTFLKKAHNLVIILVNSEDLNAGFLKKLLIFGKENNMTILTTFNKILKPKHYDLQCLFDYKKNLNYFTYDQLLLILKQRFTLTFKRKVEDELIEFLTDIIFENYIPIPGKGIDIMKNLYPYLIDHNRFELENLIELIQEEFSEFKNIDEFAMLNYLTEGDPLNLIFLDNVSSYFLNSSLNYYISWRKLRELYFLACEALEYNKSIEEFNFLINSMKKLGLLTISKKNITQNLKSNISNNNENDYFFSNLNPLKLKAMIDVIFGKCN